MSSLLLLCIVPLLLVPALTHSAVLGNPGNGSFYSGVGVISGWKCAANGPLTVRFFTTAGDPHPDWMDPIPLVYGTERPDVRKNGQCPDNDHDNVGFVAIWNWANLGDGTYTAVVDDNGVEFARSTFTVTTLGEEFVTGASGECTISDFPSPGESATFEWNQSTQSLILTEWDAGDSGISGEEQRHCVTEDILSGSAQFCQMLSSDLPVGIDEIFADLERSDVYSLTREQGSSLNRLMDSGFSDAEIGYVIGHLAGFRGHCMIQNIEIRSGSCPSGGFACQFTTNPKILSAEERRSYEEVARRVYQRTYYYDDYATTYKTLDQRRRFCQFEGGTLVP